MDSTEQVTYQVDSLVYKFLNDVGLNSAIQDINLDSLQKIGDEFQVVQHQIMMGISPSDKDAASLAIAV